MTQAAQSQFKSLIAATDWFYVHEALSIKHDAPPVVYHVAALGVDDDGQVHGLIPATCGPGEPPKLVTPPPGVQGRYAHRDELTDQERALAAHRH